MGMSVCISKSIRGVKCHSCGDKIEAGKHYIKVWAYIDYSNICVKCIMSLLKTLKEKDGY